MTAYCSAIDCALHVDMNGDIRTCCSGSFAFGNLNDQNLDSIRAKQKLDNEYCKTCNYIEKRTPGSSQRSSFLDMYGVRDNHEIKFADIRFSNTCNLSCRYCDSFSSSKWAKLVGDPVQSYPAEILLKGIAKHVDTLDRVMLVGGEPLLQKPNLQLLNMLNPDCELEIITNANTNFRKNKIYEKTKKFKKIHWNLSFDNVGDRYEYVRAGGSWQRLNENITKLGDDFGYENVTFHPIYNIWNATRLIEFYDFRDSIDKNLNVMWQEVMGDMLIVSNHNDKIIDLAILEIDKLNYSNPSTDGMDFLHNMKTVLQETSNSSTKDIDFIKWITKQELLIPPTKTFALLWPELYSIMKNNEYETCNNTR
jgi:organic radical activating enzyme